MMSVKNFDFLHKISRRICSFLPLYFMWVLYQSFYFAPRLKSETWKESIKRAEYLALRCRMGPSSKVLDVGCGVGGPMRNI